MYPAGTAKAVGPAVGTRRWFTGNLSSQTLEILEAADS